MSSLACRWVESQCYRKRRYETVFNASLKTRSWSFYYSKQYIRNHVESAKMQMAKLDMSQYDEVKHEQ